MQRHGARLRPIDEEAGGGILELLYSQIRNCSPCVFLQIEGKDIKLHDTGTHYMKTGNGV